MKPENHHEYVNHLATKCDSILRNEKSLFYDIESALYCISMLIGWGIKEPCASLLKYDNISLKILVINSFTEKIKRDKNFECVPCFGYTSDPSLQTAYLKLIVACLKVPIVDLYCLKKDDDNDILIINQMIQVTLKQLYQKVPHWLLYGIICEFHSNKNPKKSILQSPSIYDLTIEDLELASQIAEFLPLWFYLHILRIKTKQVMLAKSCIHIISKASNFILYELFDDFISFLDSMLLITDIIDDISSILTSIVPSLAQNEKIIHLSSHITKTIDFFASTPNEIQTRLQILTIILNYTNESIPFNTVCDCLIESFDIIFNYTYFPLSPKFLDIFFLFFSSIPNLQEKYDQKYLIYLCLSVISSSFKVYPPAYLTTTMQLKLFYDSKRFFAVIASDIVADPQLAIKKAYPPLPSALILLSKLRNDDIKIDEFILDCLIDGLTLCPTESSLAAQILGNINREKFIDKANMLLQRSNISSFTAAVSLLTHDDTHNIVNFEKKDDLRLLLQFRNDFAPILFQYPEYRYLLLEKYNYTFDKKVFKECAINLMNIDSTTRRIFKYYNIEQPFLERNDNWISVELNHNQSTFVFHKRMNFIPYLKDLPRNIISHESVEKSFDKFRVRYPTQKTNNIFKDIYNAIKIYRNDKQCQSYLHSFVLFKFDDIQKYNELKLWLICFSSPLILQYHPSGDENVDACLSRIDPLYSPSNNYYLDSIVFIESARRNPIIAKDIFSLYFLFKGKGKLYTKMTFHFPSFNIRILRNFRQYFKNIHERSLLESNSNFSIKSKDKDEIILFLKSLDMRNPFISFEFTDTVKDIVFKYQFPTFSKNTICDIFLDNIFQINLISNAPFFENIELIDSLQAFLGRVPKKNINNLMIMLEKSNVQRTSSINACP